MDIHIFNGFIRDELKQKTIQTKDGNSFTKVGFTVVNQNTSGLELTYYCEVKGTEKADEFISLFKQGDGVLIQATQYRYQYGDIDSQRLQTIYEVNRFEADRTVSADIQKCTKPSNAYSSGDIVKQTLSLDDIKKKPLPAADKPKSNAASSASFTEEDIAILCSVKKEWTRETVAALLNSAQNNPELLAKLKLIVKAQKDKFVGDCPYEE